jgi:hypothetical protein
MTHYVIVPTADVTNDMLDAAVQERVGDLRKSLNGEDAVLKFHGDTPACFADEPIYTHSEILTVLAGEAWQQEE